MAHAPSTDREVEYARAQHHRLVGWVYAETNQQLRTWNVQNHPMGTSTVYKREADNARRNCEDAFAQGDGTWKHILEEEFWEAMAEEDPEALEKELIQVAAVAVSMAAASRRARGA